jgi:hypothetical protein
MQRVDPEVLKHLERVIDHLYTDENRKSFIEADLFELVDHVFGSVMALDRWLSDQKHLQRTKPS